MIRGRFQKGNIVGIETRFKEGHIPYNKEKKGYCQHSLERNKKQSKTRKLLFKEGKLKPTISCFRKGHKAWNSGLKGIHFSPNTEFKIGYKFSKEIEEKRIKNVLKGLMKKPTKPELELIKIIEQNNFPYKYVGNGGFILGGKCPDFLNVNGKKQVIELFGDVFHNPEKSFIKNIPFHQTKQGVKLHYNKYGFDCLVIWVSELKHPKEIIEKIEMFENQGKRWG